MFRSGAALVALGSILSLSVVFSGCEDSGRSFFIGEDPGGPGGPPEDDSLDRADDPPGVFFEVTEIEGGSRANGNFQPGDTITVTFSVTKAHGAPWNLDEFCNGRILVSGPTFNYQRVIAEQRDLVERSVRIGSGIYRYTFEDPIPEVYLPPFNETDSFGPESGKLGGQPLLDGTYTIGIYGSWCYTVGANSFRDHGDTTAQFLVGGATEIVKREVSTLAHCNQCHVKLQFHGGQRQNLTICLMCHTSGSEDANDPELGEGTPGITIDFRVMIHKLHNGAHLPSVLGVSTNPDGSRNYDAEPRPYRVAGRSLHDYSEVEHPVYPHASIPHLRDAGYSELPEEAQDKEDEIRTAWFLCDKCHGDPDGEGPIEAPAQGDLAFSQPAQLSCGSCHDDIDWNLPYTANFQTMPPQPTNGACLICHPTTGTPLAGRDGHIHPLDNPAFNPGLTVEISSVSESGLSNGNGAIDPGEKIAVEFFVRDDAGNDVDPLDLRSLNVVVAGPTTNSNLLLSTSIDRSTLTGSQPYAIDLPQSVLLDFVGESTAALGDVFQTRFAPLGPAGTTTVQVRGPSPVAGLAATILSAPIALRDNFADVVDATGFTTDSFVVIDDGMPEVEFFQIQHIDGNRIWFDPGQTLAAANVHAAGAPVVQVDLTTLIEGQDYSLDPEFGTITELLEFGDGAQVVASYRSDYVLPTIYPRPFNSSPDVTEVSGKWTGKSIVDGTYTVTLYGAQDLTVMSFGETNSIRSPSTSAAADFLVGGATRIEPYDLITSGGNCSSCHNDLFFHGSNRRGFSACIACHGTAGSEDRPRYVNRSVPATPGVTIDFRSMLHAIHMGEELTNADTYTVVGFGGGTTFENVVFPPLPDGPKNCLPCHGEGNEAYLQPAPRNHPTEQDFPVQIWNTCLACHDSDAARAHAESQTSPSTGAQTCEICHGVGRSESVDIVHKLRDN